ncbi:MAG: AAA family ATPase [Panacagrimonas sp.]
MLHKIVPINNLVRLNDAGEALRRRPSSMPGMCLVHGETGYGKTTAVQWYANRCNAVYVRAMAEWRPGSMLAAIARDLRIAPRGSCAATLGDIIEALALSQRPLFVDEADYLAKSDSMTESLRDIHDMAAVPVVLIGMAGIDRRLSHRKQLTGRILQDVRFTPCTADDARKVADGLCEVKVADDLLLRLHRKAAGSLRLLVVGLDAIESSARHQGLPEIDGAAWGKSDQFFTGEAPKYGPPPSAPPSPLRAVK